MVSLGVRWDAAQCGFSFKDMVNRKVQLWCCMEVWKPTNGESDATCGDCSGFLRLHISLSLRRFYQIFQIKYLAKMKRKDSTLLVISPDSFLSLSIMLPLQPLISLTAYFQSGHKLLQSPYQRMKALFYTAGS